MAQSKTLQGNENDQFIVRHAPERREDLIFYWKIANFTDRYTAASTSSPNNVIGQFQFTAGKPIRAPSNFEFHLNKLENNLCANLRLLAPNLCLFSCRLYLKSENGECDPATAEHPMRLTSLFSRNLFSKFGTPEALQEFGLIPNDELQLKLEITICVKETLISAIETQLKRDLSWDLRTALETGQGADVTFTFVEGENILGEAKAHRLILSLRSSVFATMFGSGMKEATKGEVTIEDITPKAFEIILKFFYCGELDSEWESVAAELIYASDKYDLKVLQNFLCENITTVLTVKNVWKIQELAKMLELPTVIEATMNFIDKNTKDFDENILHISFKEN